MKREDLTNFLLGIIIALLVIMTFYMASNKNNQNKCVNYDRCNCYDYRNGYLKEEITFRGKITEIKENSIMVEKEAEKYNVNVSESKFVSKLNDNFGFIDLKIGDTVEIAFDGPVTETYPVGGKAKEVRLISQTN